MASVKAVYSVKKRLPCFDVRIVVNFSSIVKAFIEKFTKRLFLKGIILHRRHIHRRALKRS